MMLVSFTRKGDSHSVVAYRKVGRRLIFMHALPTEDVSATHEALFYLVPKQMPTRSYRRALRRGWTGEVVELRPRSLNAAEGESS